MTDQESTTSPTAIQAALPRSGIINALRAAAGLATVVFSAQAAAFAGTAGEPRVWYTSLLAASDLAAFVFLVISGFCIANANDGRLITWRFAAQFVRQRLWRVIPPVAVAAGVTWLIWSAMSTSEHSLLTPWLTTATRSVEPQELQRKCPHLLQPFLAVGWVAVEVLQCYLLYLAQMAFMQWLARRNLGLGGLTRAVAFAPLALLSLGILSGMLGSPLDDIIVPMPGHPQGLNIGVAIALAPWFAFFLGVLVNWTLARKTPTRSLIGMFLCATIVAWRYPYAGLLITLATSAALWFGWEWIPRLDVSRWSLVRYLSSRAYSFALCSVPVGWAVLHWYPNPEAVLSQVFCGVVVFVLSLTVGEFFYRWLEHPSQLRSRRSVTTREAFVLPPATLVQQLTSDRRWFGWMMAFGITWAVELCYIQQITLIAPNETGWGYDLFAPAVRFCFDLVFAIGIAICFRRRWLVVFSIIVVFVHIGLVTYFEYFHQALSVLTIYYQFREGTRVSQFALQRIDLNVALIVTAAFLFKMYCLYHAGTRRTTWRFVLTWGGIFGFAYVALFIGANIRDPLSRILTKRSVSRLGMIRGYFGAWLAECYYLTDERILCRALARRQSATDDLSPVEGAFAVKKHLVVLQCESLDYRLLDFALLDAQGQQRLVMPFLHELKERGLYYRIRAMHRNGTADADFGTLVGYPPSRDIITYNIPHYPYDNALPRLMHEAGYYTRAIHGYWSDFYNRNYAFRRMGFDNIIFQEDMERNWRLKAGTFGILDDDVLSISAKLLNKATLPEFQFIITLSMHGPYNYIKTVDKHLFPEATTLAENYLNSTEYFDRCLQKYVGNLPPDTTLFLYGDQCATESWRDFLPDRDDNDNEYVPCLIINKDAAGNIENLRPLHKISRESAESGKFSLLDLVAYLRTQVRRQYNLPTPPPPQPVDCSGKGRAVPK